ncbi:hypothetical protein ANRL3_02607 [Anaerolineae bacterium]|nr:hypothetical protein ANRL3_02607 [Anaerolineae bacterium]
MRNSNHLSKPKEVSSRIGIVFGLWIGVEYAVVIGVRILGGSKSEGALNIFALVAAIIWPLLYFLIGKHSLTPSRIRGGTFFALAVFLLFCLLSSFMSPIGLYSSAFFGLTLISIWISLNFISAMDGPQFETGLKIYAIIITAVLVAFAWYDYVPGTRLGNGKEILNPNSIGVITISAALAAMAIRNWLLRYGLIVMVFGIIYLTGSRSAAISSLLGLAIIGYERTRTGKNTLRLFMALGSLLVFAVLLIFWKTLWPLIDGFLQLHSESRGIGSGATGRTEAWLLTWRLFLENPVLGIGFRAHDNVLGGSSHNGYLASLAEIGLIGFTALLYLLFSGAFLLWRKARETGWTFSHSILFGLCCSNLFLAIFERYLINVGNPTSLLFLVSILAPVLTPPRKKRKRPAVMDARNMEKHQQAAYR